MTLLLLQSGPGKTGPGVASPVNTVLPVISGAATVGSTLTTTDGTWTGTPTLTYTYQWKRDGANIGGATANSYLLVTADLAATITVTVTATNTAGSASATSAGVGPIAVTYVTWDSATATAVTLSGGNLVATNTGTTSADQGAHVVAASGKTSGKYYLEMTYTTVTGGANAGVGIGTTASTYTNMGNSATTGNMTFRTTGNIYANGSNTGVTLSVSGSGVIIGIAVDLDNRKIWFRKTPSGNWNNSGTANPATNVGGLTIPSGTMVPFVTFGSTSGVTGNVVTANFGATTFNGTAPSGFTSGWAA